MSVDDDFRLLFLDGGERAVTISVEQAHDLTESFLPLVI